ncbi:hypothetical protein PFTANZ_04775 [Plasmodium falciparum Tanzania (2000708)]|uniref:Uncharacterized protein n=1 Tax=Plasmodium falciparum Tanzania (2000708) TaxID=1036725 RepID=A0A024W1S4_PLAFA|nr:hypothetical protein PFTANZ_04775 [Plasmodium falciparum Tanzania (2000708)]
MNICYNYFSITNYIFMLNILHINNNKYIMVRIYLLYNFLFLHIEYSKNCTNTILFIIKHKI